MSIKIECTKCGWVGSVLRSEWPLPKNICPICRARNSLKAVNSNEAEQAQSKEQLVLNEMQKLGVEGFMEYVEKTPPHTAMVCMSILRDIWKEKGTKLIGSMFLKLFKKGRE